MPSNTIQYSKTSKVLVIALSILGVIGIWWFKTAGPDGKRRAEMKEHYLHYKKAEATITTQATNGYVGKRHTVVWTLQYTDDKGRMLTGTMNETPKGETKETGQKVVIYYNPANPYQTIDALNYNQFTE